MSNPAPTPERTEAATPRRLIPQNAPAEATPPQSSFPFLQPPVEEDELGRLGNYRVFSLLGSGGMGMVFAAEDISLCRPVALKVMKPDLALDPVNGWQRFLREARSLAAINHPNLVTVYQTGREGETVYLAMELLRGETLESRIRRTGPPSAEDIVKIAQEIAEGLAAIHDQGLIHRDIKPANIWLEAKTPSGGMKRAKEKKETAADSSSNILFAVQQETFQAVKILDFGLVRAVHEDTHLTESGMVVGTPAFMSPEQIRGEHIDHRSDLFSFGCVLYVLCTGQAPFNADNAMAQAMALAADEPTPIHKLNPAIPKALSKLIVELLAKVPENRPESAEVVAERVRLMHKAAITVVEKAAPIPYEVVENESPRRPFLRRHAVKLVVSLWVVCAAVAIAAIAASRGNTTSNTPDTTQTTPQVVYLSEAHNLWTASWMLPHLPPGVDGSVVVRGKSSPHGIFMHPVPAGPGAGATPASITYKLNKQYRRLTTEVAINDMAPPDSPAVTFAVYGDGTRLWTSNPTTKTTGPQLCDLDVSGVNELKLETSTNVYVDPRGAHAVWIEPRLTK
jgi:serine/threonine protein kinase